LAGAVLIRARAPLRLGLAGGGSDLSPYCDAHGGLVLNATIDRYAYAVLRLLDTPEVRFAATDKGESDALPLAHNCELNGTLNLHKAVYNEIVRHHNGGRPIAVELSTFCDAPAGSGLGSSSTLVVVMLKAFAELLNLALDDYALAHLAFRIERVDCALRGGRQDQFAAAFGGFNFMEFYAGERVVINPLRVRSWILCELEASLLLFFTNVSRESATIIAAQQANLAAGASDPLEAMHAIKREAVSMKEALLKGDFHAIVDSMRSGWDSKKRLAREVSNPQLDEVFAAALRAGALAGKASGAGGGGFMMFFVPPEQRMSVVRALERFEGRVSNCHFTKQGAQAWRP
jgi:D-glycero-alpha-D-manno-heptose-7-phosphate kinase